MLIKIKLFWKGNYAFVFNLKSFLKMCGLRHFLLGWGNTISVAYTNWNVFDAYVVFNKGIMAYVYTHIYSFRLKVCVHSSLVFKTEIPGRIRRDQCIK